VRFERLRTPDEVASWVADRITRVVSNGALVIGVATGNSPLLLYNMLIERQQSRLVDLSHCQLVLLDEYVGLEPDDPRSFQSTIMRQFAKPLGIAAENVHCPHVFADDLVAACRDFDSTIEALGGVDVQILGIGRNGHIAFNEPGTSWDLGTHTAHLSEITRHDNASSFESSSGVPRQALTQGIRTILRAEELIMIATGERKSAAVGRLRTAQPTTDFPASALWTHQHATVVTDDSALQATPSRSR